MDRRRTTSRPRAPPTANGHRGSPGSDEEDLEVSPTLLTTAASVLHQLPSDTRHQLLQEVIPAQGPRASSRKRPGVDFSKLEVHSPSAARTQFCSHTNAAHFHPRAASLKSYNLFALQTASLRKYRTFYKLQDVAAGSSKDELIPAVAKHFAQQVQTLCCS